MKSTKQDAERRVTRAVRMTLRVFRNKHASPEEKEAAGEIEKRLFGKMPEQQAEGGSNEVSD